MATVLFIFVGALCLLQGTKTFWAEERNTVFNKRPIQVTDVKKYNHFCGGLIIGFGVVAEITLYFMMATTGWVSTVLTLALIGECFLVSLIYGKMEIKFLKKR